MMNHSRTVSNAPVLPIVPSLIAVAGQKRKLIANSKSTTAIHVSSVSSTNAAPVTYIPRRESSPSTTMVPVVVSEAPPVLVKPSDYWKSLLEEWNVPILDTVGIEQDDGSDSNVVFLETTPARVEAYQNIELLTAVRRRDLPTLQKIASETHSRGGTMNACNRFGESILHLACRKGSQDVVELLVGKQVEGCDCSLLVRDDYGRTVLHDACWTVNPPWELIKLILKKYPVLWRVSDIRGHLALQYVPKSAWPQWTAFLSKNKDLLQRIMVHSYHKIDILKQPAPQPQVKQHYSQSQQQQAPQQNVTAVAVASHDSSTNDAAGVPPQNLPQHQQAAAIVPQQQQQHLVPKASAAPALAHCSAAKATQAAVSNRTAVAQNMAFSVLALGTGGGVAGTSALQAQEVLLRALTQANPAMVQAISQQQRQPLQQGLSRFTPTAAAPLAAIPVKVEDTPPVPLVSAPGPATAALDEALRAQSATRSKARSGYLRNEQQDEDRKDRPHKQPHANSHAGQEQQCERERDPVNLPASKKNGAQCPIPYAPSISMIAARLAGYHKNQLEEGSCHEPEAEQQSTRNPLPAVPNPLPLLSKCQPGVPFRKEQGVPTSITTTKNRDAYPLVPNPMASSGDDNCDGNSSNNSIFTSSVTMSASPSVMEETGSETTTNASTDSDSDPSANPSQRAGSQEANTEDGDCDEEARMDISESRAGVERQARTDQDEKTLPDGTKKRIVG